MAGGEGNAGYGPGDSTTLAVKPRYPPHPQLRASSSAKCSACLWPSCWICSRQLKPSASSTVMRPGSFNGGHQSVVRDRLRDFKLVCLEAEGTGHAAAARLDRLHIRSRATQQCDFARRAAEDRLVMAVPVHQDVRAVQAGPAPSPEHSQRASRPAATPACSCAVPDRLSGRIRAAHP